MVRLPWPRVLPTPRGKNKVSFVSLELGPISSTSSSESERAHQASVDSRLEKDSSSTVGDSSLKGGEVTLAPGPPKGGRNFWNARDMAEVHLDQEKGVAFSEGDATVKPAVLGDQVPNVEESGVSAAEVGGGYGTWLSGNGFRKR